MPTYFELAQALADAGYVSDADIQAAVDILTDALIIEAAEAVEAEAMDDYNEQEDLIAKAENWVAEDAVAGDVELAEIDTDIIVDAADQAMADRDTVIIAEAVIDAAYEDAAAALLTAEIIDAVNVTAVAALLSNL
ncbi:MAG: hypothetical protein IPJ94_27420 [Chloroflexi bacterium]|nr:hypothetical protein [Chloroflexota bacterium]